LTRTNAARRRDFLVTTGSPDITLNLQTRTSRREAVVGRAPGTGTGWSVSLSEVSSVSIVRVGLAETRNFAEGYGAIFGKKKSKKDEKPAAKAGAARKKKTVKKKK
jgi:hypothetical protein